MDNFAEAFAHFCHGMAFLFFLMRAVRLFPLRRRNGRFMVFFWTMACLAFIGLENIVYMAVTEWLSADMAYSGVLVDIFMVPVVALFFFETLFPDITKGKKVFLAFVPNILFLAAYAAAGNVNVFLAALVYAALSGISVCAVVFLISFGKTGFTRSGFSCIGCQDIVWVRGPVMALTLLLVVWISLIWLDNLLADAAFYVVGIIVWEYVYRLVMRRSAVYSADVKTSGHDGGGISGEYVPDNAFFKFVPALVSCMEDGKLYLNPRLTLYDVASAVGTNRTYLSAYLNGELNTTFYDYVNGYRVREACRLIDSGTRKTLAEISELSGFNSLSTFNRAFSRHAGMSPSEYMKSSASRSC